MIFLDKYKCPVDETGDGGDSARALGILHLFSAKVVTIVPDNYEYGHTGLLMRHPVQAPWNNPWNFSRDQLMCLAPILPQDIARRVLWATLRRCCFAQNFERDVPGSTKYPWPHKVDGKWRLFDFADPLWPSHISHLVTCADAKWLKWVHIIGWPMLALQCIFNSSKLEVEQNQLQCMVRIAGPWAVLLYKKCNTNWILQTWEYWVPRKQAEIADLIIKNL